MRDPAAEDLRLPDASADELRAAVEQAAGDRGLLAGRDGQAVREVVYRLDQGTLRVAEKTGTGWTIHGWIQQAINLYFAVAVSEQYRAGELQFFDKIPPKQQLGDFRVVPPGVVRYGAHVEKGAIIMPGYVNIGARVGAGTLVDTWATVGSCAQIGKNCHISGGAGIGGVLEPLQAGPVIVEDNCFVGARSEVAEGVIVRTGSVLSFLVPMISAQAVRYSPAGNFRGRMPGMTTLRAGTWPLIRCSPGPVTS